ncbi:hypothetical protein IJH16_00075 [Candidatus Saccharibacteria bacterium]|nr:hypothetical protein [Candidatus Saccharibacteria bacterium]
MLIDATKLINYPVLSLHVGGMIAKTTKIIIDPDDLKIVGFELMGPDVGGENGTVLQIKDIREFSDIGMVVDSIDEFVNPEDVVKLDKIMSLGFELENMKVESKKGAKLGKVSRYLVNTENFMVQQFVVQRPFMKSFLDPELLIGRSEITKVTNDKIIVKDEEDKIKKGVAREDFVPNFVNPFRKPNPLRADSRTLDEQDKQ